MPPDLALVILAVEQLPRTVVFYRLLLGWEQSVETSVYCELVSPNGMRLGLYTRQNFGANIGEVPEPAAGPVATTELYFYVDDLEESLARAREAGARPLSEAADRAWGDRVAYVADLDGVVVALAERGTNR